MNKKQFYQTLSEMGFEYDNDDMGLDFFSKKFGEYEMHIYTERTGGECNLLDFMIFKKGKENRSFTKITKKMIFFIIELLEKIKE